MQPKEDQHFLNSPEPDRISQPSMRTVYSEPVKLSSKESEIVNYLKDIDDEARKKQREKGIVVMKKGSIWFFGGLILTFGYFGFFFWIFVVYGALKFLGGLVNYYKYS